MSLQQIRSFESCRVFHTHVLGPDGRRLPLGLSDPLRGWVELQPGEVLRFEISGICGNPPGEPWKGGVLRRTGVPWEYQAVRPARTVISLGRAMCGPAVPRCNGGYDPIAEVTVTVVDDN